MTQKQTHGKHRLTGPGPGRPKGVPNKVTLQVRELAQHLVGDDDYLAKLKLQLRAGKCAPAVEAMLWHYAYGKPKDIIEHQGVVQTDNVTGLPLDEIAERAERLRRLVGDGDGE